MSRGTLGVVSSLAVCVALVGVQTVIISDLRRNVDHLHAALSDLKVSQMPKIKQALLST